MAFLRATGIKLEFHGAKVSSNGGLLAHRDLDDALRLFVSVSTVFNDEKGKCFFHFFISY